MSSSAKMRHQSELAGRGGDGGGLLRRDSAALCLPNEQGTARRGSWPGRVCHGPRKDTNSRSPAGSDTAWTWLKELWQCIERRWRAAVLGRLGEDHSTQGQAAGREAREEAAR